MVRRQECRRSGDGFQPPGQPEGLPDISRGLSASDTPGTPSKPNRTLEGCQKLSSARVAHFATTDLRHHPGSIPIPFHNRCVELSKSAIVVFWHPSGVREISLSGYRGYRRCAPRPPANFCQPSGLRRSGLLSALLSYPCQQIVPCRGAAERCAVQRRWKPCSRLDGCQSHSARCGKMSRLQWHPSVGCRQSR